MALVALDFIFKDVFCMHQLGVFVLFQPFSFPMALITVFFGDFSISQDSVAVTFVTGESFIEDKSMVEPRPFTVDKSAFGVAMRTIIYLRIILTFLKVTDETTAFGNSDMFSLDDLRMTAGTLKALPPF
jgi:hypothetical protein